MILEDVRQFLIDNGANGGSWPVYIGFAPDTQDQVITLKLTGGFPPDTMQGENNWPTFQVRVRSGTQNYLACYNKIKQILDLLTNASIAYTTGEEIFFLEPLATAPFEMYDENKRPNMTINFRAGVPA